MYLNAREAAGELNVSRATLYAYVSRGMVESTRRPGSRERLYSASDIRRLRARKSPGKGGVGGEGDPLAFGGPVLDSAITMISDGGLFYRGRDALALARASSFEAVASLLWGCDDFDPFESPFQDQRSEPKPGTATAIARLAMAGAHDIRAYNLDPRNVARTGADLIWVLAHAYGAKPAPHLHQALAEGWARPEAAQAIRAALVLSADHELNASAFVVRCVASTGATPYAAVIGGLSALTGPRHGGQTVQVSAMMDEAVTKGGMAAIAARLQRGEKIPGFGHPLYPNGDVRAAEILRLVREAAPSSPIIGLGREIEAATLELMDRRPNIDFALETLARAFDLPPMSAFTIFAVGRCAGWIAHAQEQYGDDRLIRPRARYVGEEPQSHHDNRQGK